MAESACKTESKIKTAHFHLPGLFEFTELYEIFLPLFFEKREYFYDWAEISSIYGAPSDCIWGGGRAGFGKNDSETEKKAFELCERFGISARLTFSNSLLEEKHLEDKKCNRLCDKLLESSKKSGIKNGIIIHSERLLEYLKKKFPDFYFVSSTTKVLTDFEKFKSELSRKDFSFAVPDFRLNKDFKNLAKLTEIEKEKTEFLCNEACYEKCAARKECYENVSKKVLGLSVQDHKCTSPESENGYVFSKAMKSPLFIGLTEITKNYIPLGFSNFKIEGRSLGSAMILEFLLYYLTKPEYQLNVREAVYLDNTLDLF